MKIANKILILFVLGLMLASCSWKRYDRKTEQRKAQESIENEIKDIDHGTEWATKTAEIEYVPISVEWLSTFNDPILLELIEEGKSNNKTLKIAAANVEIAWLLAEQAKAGLRPTLDLALGASGSGTGSRSTSNLNINLQAAWEVDIWGRIRAGYDAAVASAEVVKADYIYAQHSLSASIARGYLLAIEATHQLDVVQRDMSLLERILKIAEFKYEHEEVTLQDVALTRSDLAAAKDNLAKIEGSHRDALSVDRPLPQCENRFAQNVAHTTPCTLGGHSF